MVKTSMQEHLDAVEKKHGSNARINTAIKHRGGRSFYLKSHKSQNGTIVNLGKLRLMTRHLLKSSIKPLASAMGI